MHSQVLFSKFFTGALSQDNVAVLETRVLQEQDTEEETKHATKSSYTFEPFKPVQGKAMDDFV